MKTKFKTILGAVLGIAVSAISITLLPGGKTAQAAEIAIDATNFPDENFRNYIKTTIDKNNDNLLSDNEIETVETISVAKKEIHDLTGISFFKNLEDLDCSQNQLTSLDISNNINLTELNCSNNQITELDISKNTALRNLYCHHNKLTELDTSTNKELNWLECSGNQLTKLNLKNNASLTLLNCYENNLIELDISNSIKMWFLRCSDNKLKNLNLSNNLALSAVNISNNELSKLDISNSISLATFLCNNNKLTQLDISHNINLETLELNNNNISEIDASNNKDLNEVCCYQKNNVTIKFPSTLNNIIAGNGNGIIIENLYNAEIINNNIKVINKSQPATYNYSWTDGTDNSKYTCTIIYPDNDDTPVTPSPVPSPTPSGNFTKPNCTRLFNDYKYTNPVAGSPVIIYGNGGTFKTGTVKTTNKQFTAYTDILASYKYTLNNKGIVKPSAGKVIVGITKSNTKPSITKNKIIDKEAAKIARAKIKNGQVTVTATGKKRGLYTYGLLIQGIKGYLSAAL